MQINNALSAYPPQLIQKNPVHRESAKIDSAMFSQDELRAMEENLSQATHFHHLTKNTLMLIGHRGMGPSNILGPTFSDPDILPENTLESFKRAVVLGCDGIELDIFKTKDGQLIVVHDDELWRNVYQQNRHGKCLPERETLESFRIKQKTAVELQQLAVGPAGEKMPLLSEVFQLVEAANMIRRSQGVNDLIINIELKDSMAVDACLALADSYIASHPDSGIDFNSIIFCSFQHNALIELQHKAKQMGYAKIQVAPGIKTAMLFGQQNVNPDFSVLPGTPYDVKGLAMLKNKVNTNNFAGYDAALWDIYGPLVELAAQTGKEIHASTSDFRQYAEDTSFAKYLVMISQLTKTFFKCDGIDGARMVLMEACEQLSGLGMQMLYHPLKQTHYLYNAGACREGNEALEQPLPVPVPYSKWRAR